MRWFYPYRSFKHTASNDVVIRSHIEYLIQTYHIFVLIILVETDEKSGLI